MYASAVIVFREVLEAALVIGIVLAASRGVRGRNLMVLAGGAVGLGGAALVALFATAIAAAAEGVGQELLNAAVLFGAVCMLAWHNVWMAQHARKLAGDLRESGAGVRAGERPLYFLGVVTALALLREGSEVVLFLYGIAAGGTAGLPMLAGGLAGLVLGVLFGTALYLGLVRIPTRHLFRATGLLILLLAAGMASQAVGFLVQAGWLPDHLPIWDSSRWLSPNSIPGELLRAFAGYEARPAPAQFLAWALTLSLILLGMRRAGRRPAAVRAGPVAA